ncbi:MAG: TIGR00730 family Rossman fold protein [Thermoleophilia bacterium]|nr:TIGR00730 family Rossman fold protein [Thermoleophilia bacterium]
MSPYPSAAESRRQIALDADTPQTRSPAYKLGFADVDFLMRDELRGVRLQLEFLKPEIMQRDRGITGTVVVFGSARIPAPEQAEALVKDAEMAWQRNPEDPAARRRLEAARALAAKTRYYDEARRLARLISGAEEGKKPDRKKHPHGPYRVVVVTGGGPGIMEAANRGAAEVGAESVGLNIVLPFEQRPNQYITPYLCFNFHYFAIRKMHFMMRARALVVFPGGFGTLDELFEVLTLIQTRKIKPIPVLLFGRQYWERVINFPALVEEGVIEPEDLEIFTYVETAEEAWAILKPVLEKNAC